MSPERLLLRHFEQLSGAPDAMSRLRGFVLDLAVRAKLAGQDLADEPSSELLKRIQRQKAAISGRSSKEAFKVVTANEQPFNIPASWQWVRLADVLIKLTDGTHHSPPNTDEGEFKYITAKNIKPEGISLHEITYVSAEVHREIYSRCGPVKGDVLYIKDGATTGVVTINDLDEQFSLLSSVALLKLADGVSNRLLVYFLRSPFFYDQMRGFMKGAAITRVTLKRMAPALLPLPPAAEQGRIVARINELMALCDELEAAQAKRERQRDRLVAATLHGLNNGEVSAESGEGMSFQETARFYFNHLPRLTTRPEHIQQLRQTILDLAVRGKLVHQVASDEPGDALLKRLRLTNPDRDANSRRRLLFTESEKVLFQLPKRWAWARLGDLAELITSGSRDWAQHYSEDGAVFVRMGNLSRGSYRMRLANLQYVKPPNDSEGTRTRLEPGDILVSITGEVGLLGLVPEEFGEAYINQHTCLIRLAPQMRGRFIPEVLRSPFAQQQFKGPQRGIKNSFRLSDVAELIVPLPPLSEQQRMVAKLDELMAICDELETVLVKGVNSRSALLEATLQEALGRAAIGKAAGLPA